MFSEPEYTVVEGGPPVMICIDLVGNNQPTSLVPISVVSINQGTAMGETNQQRLAHFHELLLCFRQWVLTTTLSVKRWFLRQVKQEDALGFCQQMTARMNLLSLLWWLPPFRTRALITHSLIPKGLL